MRLGNKANEDNLTLLDTINNNFNTHKFDFNQRCNDLDDKLTNLKILNITLDKQNIILQTKMSSLEQTLVAN